MDEVEVVVAHTERATLRVGDVFLKIDGDPTRTERELTSMQHATIPTPEVLWRRPPVLALARVPGTILGRMGQTEEAPAEAWTAAGRTIGTLHASPPPPWQGRNVPDLITPLDEACAWLVDHGLLTTPEADAARHLADRALPLPPPVFAHGDLQASHVFVEGDEVTGVIDWSEAGAGDAAWDLATLTLGHPHRLDDVLAGYQAPGAPTVDPTRIRAWWARRGLQASPWLAEHGWDPAPEIAAVRRLLAA